MPGHPTFDCRLTEVEPRARLEPPDPAFAATEGGPILVQPAPTSDGDTNFEYLAPRFVGKVALDATQSHSLRAGQFGIVTFAARDEMIGEHLWRRLSAWIRTRSNEAAGNG